MSFCKECGFRLPTGAVFCPNCGTRIVAAEEVGVPAETVPETAGAENNEVQAPAHEVFEEAPPRPKVSAAPPPPSAGGTYYGYPASREAASPASGPGKSGARTAIIVIASVVVLLIVAAVFIVNYFGGSRYTGYWESEEIDTGYGFEDELFGYDVEGMFGLQLNEDNTFRMISAFDPQILTGTWHESGNGVSLGVDNGALYIRYVRGDLLMESNGYVYRFEKSKRSIDNPSLKPGAYSGSGSSPTDPSPGNTEIAGSGEVENGGYHVSVVGAEEFREIDNKPAIRIYYEFTNNTEYSVSAYNALDFVATQNGKELEFAFSWEDVEIYSNDSYRIRPGITIQCCVQFAYIPSEGNVDLTFTGWESGADGGVVKATYVPGSLPGVPAPLKLVEIPDPEWTLSLPESGDLNEGSCHVSVTDGELISDSYGKRAIRIYFEFTNKGGAPVNMYDSVYILAYQDGVSLPESYDVVASQTDEAMYQEVAPGETVTASMVFGLRSETSSVEVEVEELETYNAVGQTYRIK